MAWLRCNRGNPCPVCGKPDWCSYTGDGAVRCMRVSDAPGLKVIRRHGDGGTTYKMSDDYAPADTGPKIKRIVPTTVNWDRLQDKFVTAIDEDDYFNSLRDTLGVKGFTIVMLGAGWSSGHFAWTFPMRDGAGKITGFRLRKRCGRKLAVKGSREGLFTCNADIRDKSTPIYIMEGPSDLAAWLDLGFVAIGRPSCRGAMDAAVEYCEGYKVVVVSDKDSPGRTGARDLAKRLVRVCPSVKIIEPLEGKDAREWHSLGATPQQVELVVASAFEESNG